MTANPLIALMDHRYGNSGYTPSHRVSQNRNTQPELSKRLSKWAKKSHKRNKTPQNSRRRKIIKIILAILAAGLLLAWLGLGAFRFLLFRGPALTGFPFSSRTYLVLFQNNYELRPTGGFISTYGELTFKNGIYRGIEFFDVYGDIDDHTYIEPPLVLSVLLEDENYTGHSFRDGNFDPDFTLAKEELIELYQITKPDAKIDGILAGDFHFLEQLVGSYEPLYVEGYELTEDNLFETLSTVVSDIDRHNEEALAERKNITSPLVKKIISKTLILPWRIPSMLKLAEQAFEEKHLLATFNRSGLEKSFEKRGWTGALPQSDAGDFLAINDANYGGGKSNRYLTRDVQLELDITDEKDVLGNPVIQAELSLTLSHEGTYNAPLSTAYTGYLRTMIPLGAKLTRPASVSEEREDVEVIGELVELEPGEEVTYTYNYELPEYVWQNGIYHLHLHKQPGTDDDHYRVVVRVPQGMSLETDHFDVRENIAFYETKLRTDEDLSFSLASDTNPPRIISHELTALNEVTVIFNENLSSSANDPLKYGLTDTNHENADTTDQVTIESVQVEGSTLTIRTNGMTPQSRERYQLTLRNVQDRSGNTTDPNPRSVTVIQEEFEEEVATEEPEASTDESVGEEL